MTRTVFEKIEIKREVPVPCIHCKRTSKKMIKAYQTLNPFNRKPDGTPKNRSDIYAELKVELDERSSKLTRVCRKCEDKAP